MTRSSPIRAGVAALGLAVAAWIARDGTRARPTAGLWHLEARGAACDEPTWRDAAVRTLVPEPFHGERIASSRCDLYRGYLVVREPTRLSIELHASGDARLSIDKQQFVALDAGAVRVTRRAERALEPGAHVLEIATTQGPPLAYLRVSARVEPESARADGPLASRALHPLDLDALAPSVIDATRVLDDASFQRRSPARLSAFLASLALALLALGARDTRRALGWGALALGASAVLALAPEVPLDPHAIAHGARAWRTLWHSSLGVFADAIPALGPEAWLLGAAWTLGGDGGPRVLAVVLGALEVLVLTATARRAAGADAAHACAVVATTAVVVRGVGVDPIPVLIALGGWLAASGPGRTLGRLARAASATPRESAFAHGRATASRRSAATLAAVGVIFAAAVATEHGGSRLAGAVALLVVLLGAASARALAETPRARAARTS